jgi:tetratricopeptide (TPR) repeat protein
MSDAGRAVFLSYASQDAEAARKICEALRSAGIEVWFDQSELRGGDAWDQKIRRQIKECALFVPVISTNTNVRTEGYFRLEWKLAVDRSHLIAEDAPFIFPVVIDDTAEPTARVPDKFREVQWTRLSVKDTPETLAVRIDRLLGARAASPAPYARAGQRPALPGKKPRWLRPTVAAVALIAMAAFVFRDGFNPGPRTQGPGAMPAAQPLTEARKLVARARAMSVDKYDSSADDFATAEGLLKQALALEQNDAEVWTFSSLFNTSIRTRGFDHAPGRREMARRDAERALKLAPDSLPALFALGRAQRDIEPALAEETFKRILARDPNHAYAMSNLANLYDYNGRPDEAIALFDRAFALDPANRALNRYTTFLTYFHYRRFEEADRAIRQSIDLEPSAVSQGGLAMLTLTWKGDAEAAARVLASPQSIARNDPRTIWNTAIVQLCRRQPAEVLKALDRLADDFIQDNWFAGPKAYFAGRAHALAGRAEAARVAWEAALAITDSRLKANPADVPLHVMRGQLLAWLGRGEEALREARTVTELRPDNRYWFGSPVLIYAALGRADDALPLVEQALTSNANANVGWPLTPALLRLDPIWDKIRGDPRFERLLVERERTGDSGQSTVKSAAGSTAANSSNPAQPDSKPWSSSRLPISAAILSNSTSPTD